MLKTNLFEFGRDGIIIFFRSVNQHELKRIWMMCISHARRKHTKKPVDWDRSYVPTLTEMV